MGRVETGMTDLPSDLQKHIVKLLATTYDAAPDFVRAAACCKEWNEFAEDTEILKSVKFGSVYKINGSFWTDNGFLVKCARAGNKRAADLIVRKKKQDKLNQMRMMESEYPHQPRNELRRTDSMFFSFGII